MPSALVALGAAVAVAVMGWAGTAVQGWQAMSGAEAAKVVGGSVVLSFLQ